MRRCTLAALALVAFAPSAHAQKTRAPSDAGIDTASEPPQKSERHEAEAPPAPRGANGSTKDALPSSGLEVVGSTTKLVMRGCPSFLDALPPWRRACDPIPRVAATLRETEGRPKTITRPASVAFASIRGVGDRRLQEKAGELAVYENGAKAGDERLVVDPYKARTLELQIAGLGAPGVHEGKVRFEVEGRHALDVPFTLVVKDSWLSAAIVIAAGTLGSYWLRRYLGDGRDRLVWRRDIRRLASRVDALVRGVSTGQRQLAVILSLRGEIDALDAAVAVGQKREDVEIAFKRLGKKVDLLGAYLEAERRVSEIKDATKLIEVQAKLDEVASALGLDASDEKLDEAHRTLGELRIDDAIRRQLDADARAFRQSIDEARGKAGPELAAALNGTVVPALEAIQSRLARGDLEGVREELDDAHRAAAVALTESMAKRIASDPPAEDATQWKAMRDEVLACAQAARTATKASDAIAAYEKAQVPWVRGRLIKLTEAVAKASAAIESANQSSEWKGTKKQELSTTVGSKLEAALAKVQGGDAIAADRACDEARAALDAFYRDALGVEPPLLLTAGFAREQPVMMAAPITPSGEGAPPAEPPLTEAALSARIATNDALVIAVLTLVATALGITIFWARGETWGTLEDYLTALLWGFGLHQMGNRAFEGLLGLRENLAKPGA